MTVETDLRAFLLADGVIAGMVDDRIEPMRLPQAPTLPAVTYQIIDEVRDYTMAGPDLLPSMRVQIDAWALTYGQAVSLSNAIHVRVDGYVGLLNGPSSTVVQGIFFEDSGEAYESDVQVYRRRRDYILRYEGP